MNEGLKYVREELLRLVMRLHPEGNEEEVREKYAAKRLTVRRIVQEVARNGPCSLIVWSWHWCV